MTRRRVAVAALWRDRRDYRQASRRANRALAELTAARSASAADRAAVLFAWSDADRTMAETVPARGGRDNRAENQDPAAAAHAAAADLLGAVAATEFALHHWGGPTTGAAQDLLIGPVPADAAAEVITQLRAARDLAHRAHLVRELADTMRPLVGSYATSTLTQVEAAYVALSRPIA